MNPIPPLEGVATAAPASLPTLGAGPSAAAGRTASFASLLAQGVDKVESDLRHADALARAFALDDSTPLHQVTFALEQARLSVELMMQVRARLVEGYQDLMRMQL